MILSFSFENWKSFQDTVAFSMIATRERQHSERLPYVRKYPVRILPIASIYGGNASGKSNFFKALQFVKRFVLQGTRLPNSPILVESYRLDDESFKKPSRFQFELLIDEIIYEFSFAVTRKEVVDEKLVAITSRSEKVLYDRRNKKNPLHESLATRERLRFVFDGTRRNQLFLTNSVLQNIKEFRPVYDWFQNSLQLIAPTSSFEILSYFASHKTFSYQAMNELLTQLDTGIESLGTEELPFDVLPEELKNSLEESLQEGFLFPMSMPFISDDRFILTKKNGQMVVEKIVTYHHKSDGSKVKFDFADESDGTRRIFDFLPVFLKLSEQQFSHVVVIDELDRSLHSLLTKELLHFFLNTCNKRTRSQLIFTTHDLCLMDQDILRRDEMWVTERRHNGSSVLFSFSDYKDIRYDKNIRKSYLQGRLGGIPKILLTNFIQPQKKAE